jgi:hypothetical protein
VGVMDTRINRHGYAIGQRSDHAWAAEKARYHLEGARHCRLRAEAAASEGLRVRVFELRFAARYHLREAARWRRSFADRVTPVPPEPDEPLREGFQWHWSTTHQEWWQLPRGGQPVASW